ncbi:MAG: chromosome segregation protein SMC, partial [Proteobacteria bacterium]|nr:chromosome segregation protein SMC [Pseudomonadota bacterium]
EVALRENRVRAEGRVESAGDRKRDLARRMADTLQAGPDQAREIARLKPEEEMPPAEDVEARLSKLKRERETMGAVNLRAEAEAAELVEQLDRLAAERADLEGAIRKLRAGIGSLNREGRQRMVAAFARVDENFQELFQRLFGGGNAHLKLVESEDVLEAGLEIMASPPGKRLQALSLLSGGEQALTAIALRFAVFLTNPSPICVLDEVDAPLDDANVTRYCDLVEEISRRTATRFLLVTHHPQTMARMDRLFGVTMAERGISQLVSVDLARAEAMREAS